MGETFKDMESKGLVSTSSSWLQRAIQQKNPRVSLELANTILAKPDGLDLYIYSKEVRN